MSRRIGCSRGRARIDDMLSNIGTAAGEATAAAPLLRLDGLLGLCSPEKKQPYQPIDHA